MVLCLRARMNGRWMRVGWVAAMVVGLSLGAGFGLMVLAVMIRFSGYLMNGGGLMIQGRYLMEGLIDGNGVARTVQGRGVVEDACRLDEEVSMSRLWVVESAKG
ncbi:hypothetical protein V6N11_049246 [Hibiscus sabdariffa]|uniref:Uncharacterized protein n=1 Tax=Hibiscus sabdariffa TaxID=183260 RepID=A0ABR2P0I2_9ROSI